MQRSHHSFITAHSSVRSCVLAALLAAPLTACGSAPTDTFVHDGEAAEQAATASSAAAASAEMRGYVTTKFGSGMANRCVNDVQTSFKQILASAKTYSYASQEGKVLPPRSARLGEFDNWDEHVQGITRIPLSDGGNWVAVTRASDNIGQGGFILVNLDPSVKSTTAFYPMGRTDHPGGLQAQGSLLAIAASGTDVTGAKFPPHVDIYRRQQNAMGYDLLSTLDLTGLGEPTKPGTTISGVALGRLMDARYTLFIAGKEGDDIVQQGWFYVSNEVGPDNGLTWTFRGQVELGWRYQNVTLLTECGTRDLYVVASGNKDFSGPLGDGKDRADLFKVNMDSVSRNVSIQRVNSRIFNTPASGFCTFRAAAAAYVNEQGQLSLYCHTHHAGTAGKLKLGVYPQPAASTAPDFSNLTGAERQRACETHCNDTITRNLQASGAQRLEGVGEAIQQCIAECVR